MKKTRSILSLLTFSAFLLCSSIALADGGMVAFYKIGTMTGTITQVAQEVKTTLEEDEFEILGEYNPGKNPNWHVIAFSREDLLKIVKELPGRSILAGVLKVGLIADGNGNVELSLLNPDYLFYAYLRDDISYSEGELLEISMDVKVSLFKIGSTFIPYGSKSLTESELKYFRFMAMDPSFDEPIVIKEFNSFKSGVRTIQNNLKSRRENTYKVFEIVDREKEIAYFGVGLLHAKKGEKNFLSQLGESHLAALPYEIVVIGKTATILPGQYRFPLYWSDLTMKEFRRIYRTHRDIEHTMIKLTE